MQVFGDDPRAPVQINNELLCESCHAIFDVVDKKMGGKWTSEDALYSAMDGVCEQNNFRVYKMIPPTMKKGCEAFLDRYGEGARDDDSAGAEDDFRFCVQAGVPPPSWVGEGGMRKRKCSQFNKVARDHTLGSCRARMPASRGGGS